MKYDQLAVNWRCLLPAADAKALTNKRLTFYIPLYITKGLDGLDKPVFSRTDIDAIFATGNLKEPRRHYFQNSILLELIAIRVNRTVN